MISAKYHESPSQMNDLQAALAIYTLMVSISNQINVAECPEWMDRFLMNKFFSQTLGRNSMPRQPRFCMKIHTVAYS